MPIIMSAVIVSTHSRPKAAATQFVHGFDTFNVSTHSRPKAAAFRKIVMNRCGLFQHTAARRRLFKSCIGSDFVVVSTHSRPKAAVWNRQSD